MKNNNFNNITNEEAEEFLKKEWGDDVFVTLINNRYSPLQEEAYWMRKLSQQLGGQPKVIENSLKIDLLTENEVIEIKKCKNWIHAVGQIIVYHFYYPNHQPVIYLFGEPSKKVIDLVEKHCSTIKTSNVNKKIEVRWLGSLPELEKRRLLVINMMKAKSKI